MMTRKHFEAVASIISEADVLESQGFAVHKFLIEEFVAFFSEENDRFDIDRFKIASAGYMPESLK